MDGSLLTGISVFRWLAWAWMATVLFFDRHGLVRPWLALVLVGLALVVTARRRIPVVIELLCGCALFLGGGLAFAHGTAFADSQSLGVAWPLAGVLMAGAAFGSLTGALSGVVVGLARLGGGLLNGVTANQFFENGHLVSTLTPIVLFALAGGALGHLVALLRNAESEVAAVRAREEVARTLHDGVLQTLAVVERRSADSELAAMARDQQRELRAYLAGPSATATPDLLAQLRMAAAQFERRFGGRVDIVAMDDLPRLPSESTTALAGAVGEALTNAGKHGQASRVTVFMEATPDGLFCSVKDDGVGFDPNRVIEGMGIARSMRGRIVDVGGRMELSGQLGEGAEVRLWV